MWVECAKGHEDAPTTEEVEAFLKEASFDDELIQQVYHRFVLTRGGRKFISWLGNTFFFRNATKEQKQRMHDLVPWRG